MAAHHQKSKVAFPLLENKWIVNLNSVTCFKNCSLTTFHLHLDACKYVIIFVNDAFIIIATVI